LIWERKVKKKVFYHGNIWWQKQPKLGPEIVFELDLLMRTSFTIEIQFDSFVLYSGNYNMVHVTMFEISYIGSGLFLCNEDSASKKFSNTAFMPTA